MRAVVAMTAVMAVTVVLIAAGAGGAGAQVPTPTPTPSVPVEVTLTATPGKVLFDGRTAPAIALSGRVTGTAALPGIRVELTGVAPRFDRVTIRRTATTDAAGAFTFRLHPQANARYRVRVVDGQAVEGASPRRTVRLFPKSAIAVRPRSDALRLAFTLSAPARIRFASGKSRPVTTGKVDTAFFYLRLRGEQRFRRVGTAKLGKVRCKKTCTRVAGYTERRADVLSKTKNAGACVTGEVFRGLGGPSPCGSRRLDF